MPDVEVEGKIVAGARGFMEKLARVQRASVLQITGALRTTPSDLLELEAHAGLLPMDLRVGRTCIMSAARITTLPDIHPLNKLAHKAACFVKRHRSPLHYILKIWGPLPKEMETIATVQRVPDWRCPIEIVIGETAEEAEERERNNEADVQIYMDGSGYKGHIGAAAVLYRGMKKVKVLRKCVGPEEKHMVFEGECMGQVLGFELLRREVRG